MVEIRTLGGVDVRHRGGEPVVLRSRKHMALLVFLAASKGRSHTRERLTQLLWTSPPERARHSLSQAFYDLSRKLEGVVRTSRKDLIGVDPRRVDYDALRFEAAVEEDCLDEAIGLYRGPFAESLVGAGTPEFDRWLESHRARLHRLAELAFRRYVAECEGNGRWSHMCTAALSLIEMTPLDQAAHLALMRALWLQGDGPGAVAHFESVAESLQEEIPGGISEELTDFVARLHGTPMHIGPEAKPAEVEGPLVGRTAEFEMLHRTVKGLGTSKVSAVLVSGEAGIGKSRLLREFRRSPALEGFRLIESRCFPAEQELPYGPIVEAVGPIASELLVTPEAAKRFARLGYMLPDFPAASVAEDEGVDPSAWRRRLYEEVSLLLRMATDARPIIWLIDDAHWIDDTSAGLLHYVARRISGARFLVVAAVRAPRNGPLPERIPVASPLESDSTLEVRLKPLTQDEVRELIVTTRPEMEKHPVVSIAQRLASGNPFYALALLMTALTAGEWTPGMEEWEPLNEESVRHLLAVRFRNLGKPATRLLQSVAVLERHATPRLVSKVAGLELEAAADESAELYSKGLLIDGEARLDFVNDLMREYIYTEMTGMRRTAMHLRAARMLESEPDAGPGLLARHYLLGDEKKPAYRYAMTAAVQASKSGGHAEAVVMAGLARSAAANPEESLAALRILAESELSSAQLEAAREHFAELLRLQPELPVEEVIRLKLRMVACSIESSRWETSKETLQDIQSDLQQLTDESAQLLSTAEALYWRLKVAIRQREPRVAQEIAATLDVIVMDKERWNQDSLTNEARVSVLVCKAAYALFFVDTQEAGGLLDQARALTAGLPEKWTTQVDHLSGLVATRQAGWDRATHVFRKIEAQMLKRDEVLVLTAVWNNLACCAMERGEWDECERYLAKVEKTQETLEDPLDVALLTKLNAATANFYQGRVRDSEAGFLSAQQLAMAVNAGEFLPQIEAWLALIAIQRGEQETALKTLDRLSDDVFSQRTGAQEVYQLEWLRTYLTRSEKGTRDRLHQAIERLSHLDLPSAWKLSCIETVLLDRKRALPTELQDKLRDHSMSWFPFFLRRWYDSARGA